jgi:hypothetical protein
METACHSCGRNYTYLSRHWRGEKYDCDFPEPTDREGAIIKGILMSDGSLSRNSSLANLQVSLKNEQFIEWLSDELYRFGAAYELVETASEVADRIRGSGWSSDISVDDCNDIYQLRTAIHPVFEQYDSWYVDGTMRYPSELDIGPMVAKMWYVADGDLKNRTRETEHKVKPRITCRTEASRSDWLLGLFEDHGFEPYWDEQPSKICFPVSDVDAFFNWIGDPIPGMERKWPSDHR